MKRKKLLFATLIVLFLLIAGGGYLAYRWKSHQQTDKVSWMTPIPKSAVYMLQTDRPRDLWEKVHNNPLFQSMKQLPDYDFLSGLDDMLTRYVIKNQAGKQFFRHRTFALSAHIVAGNDYDFLYVLDLKNTLPAKQMVQILRQWLPGGIKIKSLSINKQPAWKISGLTDDPLYVSFYKNLAVMSFSYQILRQSLMETKDAPWLNNKQMQYLSNEIDDGLARLYFNYDRLPAFVNTFGARPGPTVYAMAKAFRLSGLAVDQDDNLVTAQGLTLPDSSGTFLSPFHKTGGDETEATALLPDNTLIYTSIQTDDFADFYHAALGTHFRSNPQAKATYLKYTRQIKKWIGFDMDKDFIAWIGGETGIAQLPGKDARESTALFIRADDIDFAREKMDLLTKRLRKRTPVKFRSYDYDGYTINYLAEKSFFRILFGKWMNDLTTPYYTIAGDFVIFSNSAKTLESILQAHINRQTLNRLPAFRQIKKASDGEAHIQVMLNVPDLYTNLYKTLPPGQRKSLAGWYAVAHSLKFVHMQWLVKDKNIWTQMIFQTQEK